MYHSQCNNFFAFDFFFLFFWSMKVVFFGDNVPKDRAEKAKETARECDGFLVIGSSVMTMSAFRIVRYMNKDIIAYFLAQLYYFFSTLNLRMYYMDTWFSCLTLTEEVNSSICSVLHVTPIFWRDYKKFYTLSSFCESTLCIFMKFANNPCFNYYQNLEYSINLSFHYFFKTIGYNGIVSSLCLFYFLVFFIVSCGCWHNLLWKCKSWHGDDCGRVSVWGRWTE